MSWKDAFKYAKGLAGRHGVDAAKKEERSDDGLPLGGRIGGIVTLQMSPFIRAEADGSLIQMPTAPDAVICAISRLRMNINGKLYRYYTDLGDTDGNETFLQVYADEQGVVQEMLYCTHLTRFIPETEEDQDAFTGASGVGLGEKNYSLWREQLESLGVPACTLDAVFGGNDSIEYHRDAGNSSVDFMAPLEGTETRVDDAIGEHGLEQKFYFMPYARAIGTGDTREYLLISTEIVESQDGDKSRRDIHVDLMIGLAMDASRVTIL